MTHSHASDLTHSSRTDNQVLYCFSNVTPWYLRYGPDQYIAQPQHLKHFFLEGEVVGVVFYGEVTRNQQEKNLMLSMNYQNMLCICLHSHSRVAHSETCPPH